MTINLSKIIAILVFSLLICLPLTAKAQMLEYPEQPVNNYTIAIIPIKPNTFGIYQDNLNYVSSCLVEDLNKIRGLQALNVLHTTRVLKQPYLEKHLTSIRKNYDQSQYPDPDDLAILAQALRADKIILVSGGFDVEKDIVSRGLNSKLMWFNDYIIQPRYDYNVYIRMFDPLTGNLDWQKVFFKRFAYKNFFISGENTGINPGFQRVFNRFTQEIALKSSEELQLYFYGVESSTVSVEILNSSGKKIEATDGTMTKDGHPFIPPVVSPKKPSITAPIAVPEQYNNIEEPPVSEELKESTKIKETASNNEVKESSKIERETEIKGIDTPYNNDLTEIIKEKTVKKNDIDLNEVKPLYEQELMNEYHKKMLERY